METCHKTNRPHRIHIWEDTYLPELRAYVQKLKCLNCGEPLGYSWDQSGLLTRLSQEEIEQKIKAYTTYKRIMELTRNI